MMDTVHRSISELPAASVHVRGFAIYSGYYKLDVIHKHADGSEEHDKGGFVIGNGTMYLAVSDADHSVYGLGFSVHAAINSAIELEQHV